jgi:hypothetical protein
VNDLVSSTGRRFALALLLVLPTLPGGLRAQASPGTDIWAFRLSGNTLGVDLTSAIRVTQRTGYDNQPHFPPGERLILYTAIDSLGQADIWSYDLNTGDRKNVTRSDPESEYSATVMPSRVRFSAIRVEADSTQRLWSFDSGGANPEVILRDIQPVGYHAWLDDDRLALFVLGTPATLQIASAAEGTAEVVAEDIGRSVHRIPGRETVSFVQWLESGAGWINEYNPETGETTQLAPLLVGNEFYAWTAEGVLVMGQGSKLFRFTPSESETWEEIADLKSAGILTISRLSLSPGGGWLAVVGADEG